MHMIDVLSKLKEIAENYESEDVQRAITAAETQVHENQDDVEEGKYKSDAQRRAVHAAKKEKMSEEYDDDGFGDETNPVADSILIRLTRQHPQVFGKYGLDAVERAADEVADYVGDVEEIGSSDVSIWVKHALEMLQNNPPEAFGEDAAIEEGEESPYVCVHAKKGKYECSAESSYGAAKKAAEHWKLKSTAGIDTYLADVTHTAEGAIEEVHEDVEEDTSLADILRLAGQSGVVGMNQNNLLSESVYHELDEDDLQEAYIKTSKDAIDTLGDLRKIGKKIETGQDTYDGNLANMYANDVYDVISWVENNLDTNDPKYKQILAPVIELRKKAKGMERELGSGKNARFGNEIVNTLYPLMQWIEMNAQGSRVEEGGSGDAPEYADADADDKRWDDAEEEEEGDVDMEETVEVPVSALSELMRLAGYKDYEAKINEYENDPEEEYYDTEDQLIGLSGGLNRPKNQYSKAQPGDNPMAMRALKTDDVNEASGKSKYYVDFEDGEYHVFRYYDAGYRLPSGRESFGSFSSKDQAEKIASEKNKSLEEGYTFESAYKRYQEFINKDSE